MLGRRVVTAVVLLLLLAAVLGSGSLLAFHLTLAAFFGAAVWEALRLSGVRAALPVAVLAAFALPWLADRAPADWLPLAWLCVLLWVLRFAPALRTGLPPVGGARGMLFALIYLIALFGCFIAIAGLWQRSVTFLVSAMAVIWVADIGAYFAGRAFGRRKLAPSISPGKSWEGVVGGLLAVLVFGAVAAQLPLLSDSFPAQLQARFGWAVWVVLMAAMVAASVVGDLFESLIKRRAGSKDSSHLLPGHGGVLDRIDALVPTMPLALLLSAAVV